MQIWPAGRPIVRCHNSAYGATEFNPGKGPGGRFHPFVAAGAVVGTLYGADGYDGALSETALHDVPVQGPARRVLLSALVPFLYSTLAARRDLRLVQLHGYGLGRLGATRSELIETADYAATRDWARRLHAHAETIDGLVWVSRQHDTSLALVLFADRVERSALEVVEPAEPLAGGSGYLRLQEAAEKAGITVVL